MPGTLLDPDAHAAAGHRQRLELSLTGELNELLTSLPGDTAPHDPLASSCPSADEGPLYPGLYSAYHSLRKQDAKEAGALWFATLRQEAAYRTRRRDGLARTGESDYAARCVRRALSQAPPEMDRSTVTSHLTDWSPPQRALLDRALALLDAAWPQAYTEVVTAVAEVSLLGGHGLIGFTDFVAHGAVFISDFQLTPRDGVSAEHLLAESLLHEATHTVCNASATTEPLIRSPRGGEAPRVSTPLRSDPRPLAGLTQQLVVLTRCAELYARAGVEGSDGAGLARRAQLLAGQAAAAGTTLRKFEKHLTEAGVRLVDEAERRRQEATAGVGSVPPSA
ncbi:aKG-HExxH-type peptide beta-hydroxylase [Streptomyces sp. NBC_01013]|uniref:aKG-HExxH-type peptide beta-hydroxylase n=1 Tax=Streptomyces sp. NBC_01013 TaxID=2903718 RepID=UPI003868B997|nr:HEXXH motif-containing putative peptide modification protein [Streptomyces sp. NBC_01013]